MGAYQGGDAGAFRELFDRYATLLQRVLERDLDRREEARDLVQQAFLQLHRARADYQPDRPFRPWLFTIALNLKRQYFRTRSRRPRAQVELDEGNAPASGTPDGEAAAEARQVRDALQRIPAAQRDAIILHWYEGFTFGEIAQILGAKESAIKVRAHRGYEQLRKILGDSVTENRKAGYQQ